MNPGATAAIEPLSSFTHPKRMKVVATVCCTVPILLIRGTVPGALRKVNTIYLEHIAKNTQPAGSLLKDTAAETKAVFVVGFTTCGALFKLRSQKIRRWFN